MFLSNTTIIDALKKLEQFHPFYGITYLTCKSNKLPVSDFVEFPINTLETSFLEKYYKPINQTEKFFRVFRPSEKSKFWLNSDYASSGSQATRTQNFADVFMHKRNSNLWAWDEYYIEKLSEHLGNKKINAWHLSCWLYKDVNWASSIELREVINRFWDNFFISKKEIDYLFDKTLPKSLFDDSTFSEEIYDWDIISDRLNIPPPPDLPIQKGGSLVSLNVNNVGTLNFDLNLKSRLNIITGDNGLGKSFILECAWWSLTNTWTSFPFYPDSNITNNNSSEEEPEISFKLSNKKGKTEKFIAHYNWRMQNWHLETENKKTIPGLVIYARVDGAFAIWDPSRTNIKSIEFVPSTLIFSREEIWNGLRIDEGNKSRFIFNGLITDWVHWQNGNTEAFEILKKVLKRLSPPDLQHGDLGILEPGKIVRIPGESRPIPTIKHPYGEVPISLASAAVKRIIGLAYLIVWTWEEHKTSSKLIREEPETKMVVIADEIESHLHPQWQRVILPALTSISQDLSKNLNVQYLITTHSPLVMASVEQLYNEEKDKIFHLNLKQTQKGAKIVLECPEFQRRGSADSWLVSEIFELKQPRSLEAERIIEKAKRIQSEHSPKKNQIEEISKQLHDVLPSHDTFWIRWNYFAEQHGINEE